MIYKTPLFKAADEDEKDKTIGIEDLQPNIAQKIMNAITPEDIKLPELEDFTNMFDFPELTDYDFPELFKNEYPKMDFPTSNYPGLSTDFSELLSGINDPNALNKLYSALKYLLQRSKATSGVEIITHGWFQSERRQYPVDQGYISYSQNIVWDEVRFKQKFESKGSVSTVFAGYKSHYGNTGLTGSYNNATGYHRVFIFDVAGALGVSATPLPDEIVAMCEAGEYSLNVSYGGTGDVQNIPLAQSEIYGSDGTPLRDLTSFSQNLYNCLATFNLSNYPVSVNAEIIIPTRPVTAPEE